MLLDGVMVPMVTSLWLMSAVMMGLLPMWLLTGWRVSTPYDIASSMCRVTGLCLAHRYVGRVAAYALWPEGYQRA